MGAAMWIIYHIFRTDKRDGWKHIPSNDIKKLAIRRFMYELTDRQIVHNMARLREEGYFDIRKTRNENNVVIREIKVLK